MSSFRTSIFIGCFLVAMLSVWPSLAIYAAPSTDAVEFNIPAGNLTAALDRFAEQSGLQVVYDQPVSKTAQAKALRGHLSRHDALDQLLKGSGLAWSYVNDSTVVVRAPKEKIVDVAKGAAGAGAADAEVPVSADLSVNSQRPKLAFDPVADADLPRTINDVQPYYIFDSQTIEQSGATNIEDFLKQRLTMNTTSVTNSQLYGTNHSGAAPPGGGTSSINLRGLGTNETLILVDGRRMAGITYQGNSLQPDVNGIPLAAIDRIEILPSSASGIYGGSAIGGVVNIILKRDYKGGDFRFSDDQPVHSSASTRTLDATDGFSFEDGKSHVLIAAHYADAKPLLVGDRADLVDRWIANARSADPTLLYNPFVSFNGATTNIQSTDGTNLILKNGTPLNSPYTHISPGANASTNLSNELLANAGTFNLNPSPGTGSYGLANDIGSTSRVESLSATVRRQMTSWLEAFADFAVGRNDSSSIYNPFVGSLYLPLRSTLASDPFTNNIVVTIPSAVAVPLRAISDTGSITTGLTAKLAHGWTGEMDYTWSKNTLSNRYFNAETGSSGFYGNLKSGVVNPFVDSIANPFDPKPYLLPQTYSSSSTVNDIAIRASGPVLSLPWGDPNLTIGLEHRKEGYPTSTFINNLRTAPSPFGSVNTTEYFGQSEYTNSLYAEAGIPLITTKNALPALRSLDLQFAGRAEYYSVSSGTQTLTTIDTSPPYFQYFPAPPDANPDGSGGTPYHSRTSYSSKNESVGLKYVPIEDVTLRVSRATAFLPPTYGQLLPNPVVCNQCDFVTDPTTGASYPVNIIAGGNPNLKPQHSKSWDLGLIYQPQETVLKGLRIDFEFYHIEQFDYITALTGNQILSIPGLANRVTRDPATGQITQINESDINATEFKTQGWDLSFDYRIQTSIGTFDLYVMGTDIMFEKRQFTTDTPMLDYAGFPDEGGEARSKANASLTWAYRPLTLGWTTTWFGSYMKNSAPNDPAGADPTNSFLQGGNAAHSQAYHQLFASYAFGKESYARLGILSNVTVQLIIKDLFNKAPPFDADGPLFSSPYGDLRERDFWIGIKKTF